MTLKGMIDRRLVLSILSPLARVGLSALVGYLTAKGLPADLVDQVATALGSAAIVTFNVSWELIDRKKAENRGVRRTLDELHTSFEARP